MCRRFALHAIRTLLNFNDHLIDSITSSITDLECRNLLFSTGAALGIDLLRALEGHLRSGLRKYPGGAEVQGDKEGDVRSCGTPAISWYS